MNTESRVKGVAIVLIALVLLAALFACGYPPPPKPEASVTQTPMSTDNATPEPPGSSDTVSWSGVVIESERR